MTIITIEKYTWEGRTGKRSKGFSSRELLNKIRSKAPAFGKLCEPYQPENLKWYLEMAPDMPLSIPSAVQ